METTPQLSNLQIELLKMFNYDLPEEQLNEVKELLSSYFANTATKEMDKLWEEKGWDEKTITNWKNEHLRTEYK